jgi:hypothetical protein
VRARLDETLKARGAPAIDLARLTFWVGGLVGLCVTKPER